MTSLIRRTYYLFFTLTAIISGCDNSELYNSVERLSLSSTPLKVSESLGRTFTIDMVGSYLVARDNQANTKLTLFDLQGDLSNPIYTGYIGQGPGELLDPGHIIAEDKKFMIYEGSKKKLLCFDLDSVGTELYRPKEKVSIQKPAIIDVKKISESLFLAVGLFPNSRFLLFDVDGKVLGEVGDYPIPITEGMPYYIRGMACKSLLTTNREKNISATAMRYGENIQFHVFNLHDYTPKMINERNVFLPEFTIKDVNGSPNFKPTEETRWGYLSITSNPDFVYALYSGKLQIEGTGFNRSNQVHVFDWEGNLVKILDLDQDVSSITCNTSQLFALYGGEDGYEIAAYKL